MKWLARIAGSCLLVFGLAFLMLSAGNIFLVIPDDEKEHEHARQRGATNLPVLTAELKALKDRTNLFLLTGGSIVVAGVIVLRKGRK